MTKNAIMKKYAAKLIFCLCLHTANAQWVATVAGVLETPGFNDGPALSSRFFNPHGIAVDGTGKVYVADRYNHTIRKFDPTTGLVTTLAGKALQKGDTDGVGADARFNEPWGLCATDDGVVYVADTKNNKIRKILPNGMVSTYAGTGNYGTSNGPAQVATFGNPTGIEVDSAGNVYVADHLTHIIRKIKPNGTVSTLAGIAYVPGDVDGPGAQAQFWRPYGLTIDPQGNIIVADEWNHKIRRITPQGEVTTIAGNGEVNLVNGQAANSSFNYPWDMTVDPAGNIYVADGYNYVIRKIGVNGTVSSLAGSPQTTGGVDGEGAQATFSGATSIAWSNSTGTLFVGDAYNHLVREISLDGIPTATLTLINLNGTTNLCEGDAINLQASPSIYDSYDLYVDNVLVQSNSSTGFTVENLTSGTHTMKLEAGFQSEVLVSNEITFEVTALPQPTISPVGPLSFYEGDSVILVATGTGSLLWSNGETSQTITVTEGGEYFVEETINGCTGQSENITVEVTLLPDEIGIVLEGNSIFCKGQTALLHSTQAIGNQWIKDGWLMGGETQPTLKARESGMYQVQYTDPTTGITTFSDELEITVLPAPDFDFLATPTIGQVGQKIDFRSTGSDVPISYLWDFGDPASGSGNRSVLINPSHTYEEEGRYSVTLIATDQYNCMDTVSKKDYLQIINGGNVGNSPIVEGLFIPNAFTPNSDGENDTFRVRGYTGNGLSMAIFNQWGELLFFTENGQKGWDGTKDGLPVHAGTYTYLVNLNNVDSPQQMSGHVTLLR